MSRTRTVAACCDSHRQDVGGDPCGRKTSQFVTLGEFNVALEVHADMKNRQSA
jgi:hypothetical protein